MAESSITVAVRIRPFSEKEAAQLAPQDGPLPFLGDGGLSGGAPSKHASTSPLITGAQALRSRFLRPIIHPVDDKVLIFDPPDNNPLSRLYNNSHANYMSHGHKRAKDVRYAFDRVFDANCDQKQVFEGTTRPLLDGILQGYNASVFAYGATGCGKTHTISGTPEDPGVIFLTMKDLYARIEESRADAEVHVRLSYLEIYNETIRDLLSEEPTPPGQGLLLREDQANKISVVGISEHTPESPEQVLEMIQVGNQKRTMSPTEANAVSSRSHAVLQINVTQKPRTGDTIEETTSASLNIIDLAGSERAAATSNNGARMKEGANINKSLLALGNCINALCQSGGAKGRHIPYRNSKLTRLLKFSLGGNCKTVMIVCVSPSSGHYDETSNTLKYANQAKNIRTKVSQNLINVDRHVAQYVQTIHELREEVAQLKKQLAEVGGLETGAERKRKRELQESAKAEASEVTAMMKSKAATAKDAAASESQHDAASLVATARQALLGARLAEIEACLSRSAGNVSPGNEDHSDIKSERNLIQQLLQNNAGVLQESEAARSRLDNRINLIKSQLSVAPRNSKFDEECSERVSMLAGQLKAEIEAVRFRARTEAIEVLFRQEAKSALSWLSAACRGTVELKDASGELDWRATNEDSWSSVSDHLSLMAERLRSESKRNDDIFQSLIGVSTLNTLHHQSKHSSGSRAGVSGAKVTKALPSSLTSKPPGQVATANARHRAGSSRRASQVGMARPTLPLSPARKGGRTSLIGTAGSIQGRVVRPFSKRISQVSGSGKTEAKVSLPARPTAAGKSHQGGPPAPSKSTRETLTGKQSGVRFAADVDVCPTRPRRSTTPDCPPPAHITFCPSDASWDSDWIDTNASPEERKPPVGQPRVSRMPMAAPAPLTATRSQEEKDPLSSSDYEDELDSALLSKVSPSVLPASTVPDENAHQILQGDGNGAHGGVSGSHRHAPYRTSRRRDSGVGPARRVPSSGSAAVMNTSRRVSSAEAAGVAVRRSSSAAMSSYPAPLSGRPSKLGARSSGITPSMTSTSMFGSGKISALHSIGAGNGSNAQTAFNANQGPFTSPGTSHTYRPSPRAWGPPGHAAARAARVTRDDSTVSSATADGPHAAADLTANSDMSIAAKVRRSVPAAVGMPATGV
ncbi:unnamed protein product [Parajaminaea phylloscopi]